MGRGVNRREFMKAGATGIAVAGAGPAFAEGPTVVVPKTVKPVVVASANGNRHKNKAGLTCVEQAFRKIVKGDDVLDSVVAGVQINELDPDDTSVGYGGLPNAEGVVQLDASVMHGPRRRAGAVASIEGVRTPSLVAQAVMDNTDHHLLVGQDAQDFARKLGFTVEDDLNTPKSRELWLQWKRRIDPQRYLDPATRGAEAERVGREMMAEGLIDPQHYYGTINCNGIGPKGELCGVTTTSGLAWKIPGRVGDSPILGAGLYVDPDVGACGSTGRGEANLYALTSFLIVENMRRGLHPKDAGMDALKRVKANTVEKRLLDDNGNPTFYVHFYIVNRKGQHAGVSFYSGKSYRYAVCTENGPQTLPLEGLLGEAPPERS